MNSKKRPRDESTSSQNEKRLRHDSPELQDTSQTMNDPIEESGNDMPDSQFKNGIDYRGHRSMLAEFELRIVSEELVDPKNGNRLHVIEDSTPLVIGNLWEYQSQFYCDKSHYELFFGLDSYTENIPCNEKNHDTKHRKVIFLGKKTGEQWNSKPITMNFIAFSLSSNDEMCLNIVENRLYFPYMKVKECASGIFTKFHHLQPITFLSYKEIAEICLGLPSSGSSIAELPSSCASISELPPSCTLMKPHLEKLLMPENESSQFIKRGRSISGNAEKMLKEVFNSLISPDGNAYPVKYEYQQLSLMLEVPQDRISQWFVLQNGHNSCGESYQHLDNDKCSIVIKSLFDPSQVAARFLREEFLENNEYPHDVLREVGKPFLDKLLSEFFHDKRHVTEKKLKLIVERRLEESNVETTDIDRRALDLKFKESKLSVEETIQQEMGFDRVSPEKFEQSKIQLVDIVSKFEVLTKKDLIKISKQFNLFSPFVSYFHTLCKQCETHRDSLHDYLLNTGTVKWSTATVINFYEKYWNIEFHQPCDESTQSGSSSSSQSCSEDPQNNV
ncbi:hypothetical protein CAEBREN_10767 [Caenorhabditis brenneri]|uniref:Uncharacterized protein n=1 Tax=Caenorhabditis brenneri TaxID=135651 RepID=G0MI99_CAEBE|nr:hypothetical protein CAEBREN_10767 [Caenorhabditis brenneri]